MLIKLNGNKTKLLVEKKMCKENRNSRKKQRNKSLNIAGHEETLKRFSESTKFIQNFSTVIIGFKIFYYAAINGQ